MLNAITQLGWTVLPHPQYSPQFAPSDFRNFGALKDITVGKGLAVNLRNGYE
jgi:hypothetical protein